MGRAGPALTSPSSQRWLGLRFVSIYFWTFWLQCIMGTFLFLYLRRRGFTGTDIGILGATSALTGLLVTPLIGIRFDSSHNRPRFLAGLAVGCGLAFISYSLPLGPRQLIPSAVLLAAFWLPIIPLTDSLAFSKDVLSAAPQGYGGYRRWGSIGFAVAGVAVGALAKTVGLKAIFPAYFACALICAALSLGIPRGAIPAGDKTLKLGAVLDLLRIRRFRLFLGIMLLSFAGSSACFSFRAIYLDSIGVPESVIGALYVLPIAAEVVCFSYARHLAERFGPMPLIAAGLSLSTARWWILSFMSYSPFLFLTEILHGVSFAVFYPAALSLIGGTVPARLRGTAQILFFSSALALGGTVGSYLGGRLFDFAGMLYVLRVMGSMPVVAGLLHLMSARIGAGRLKPAIAPEEPPAGETAQN